MHNCETSLLGAEDSCIQIFLISGVPGVGKTTLSYELLKRLSNRDAKKYMPYLDVLFEANCELYKSTQKLCKEIPDTFQNLDVTYLSIEKTIATALECFS